MRIPTRLALLALAVLVAVGLWRSVDQGSGDLGELHGAPGAPVPETTVGAPARQVLAPALEPPGRKGVPSSSPGVRGGELGEMRGVHQGGEAVPAGMARLVVKVTGGPSAAAVAASGKRAFDLSAYAEEGMRRMSSLQMKLEGPEAVRRLDVPSNMPLMFGLSALGHYAVFDGPAITLAEGATGELAVDLGHGRVRTVRIEDVPCDVVSGLAVVSRGAWGSVRLPGGREEPFDVSKASVSNAQGEAAALVPEGAEASYTLGMNGRSFPAMLSSSAAGAPQVLRPAAPLVMLRSEPGTKLFVGDLTVAAPLGQARGEGDAQSHLALLPAVLPEGQRVLVDGESLGAIGPDAWPLGGSLCLDVADLVWAEDLPTVAFQLLGFEGQKATLKVYSKADKMAAQQSTGAPVNTYKRSFAALGSRMPMGLILDADRGVRMKALGKWESEGPGVRTSTVFLRPGEYMAALELAPSSRRILLLSPFVVLARGAQDIVLDSASVRPWTIAPRDTEGLRPTGQSMPGSLWVEGLKLEPNRRLYGQWPYQEGPVDGPEPSFFLETFGRRPASATLARSPGANGTVVPLRPPTALDAVTDANLVAVVPALQMLYLPLTSVTGGSIGGAIDGDVDLADADYFYSSDIQIAPSSISFDEERGLAVALRRSFVTGVVTERRFKYIDVRDWFSANGEGIVLAGGGRGRFVSLSCEAASDLTLQLVPKPSRAASFLPAYHGRAFAKSTRRLWIPESALRLEWWSEDGFVGSTEDLERESITIR